MEELFNHTIWDHISGSNPSGGRECGRIEGPSDRVELLAAIGVLASLVLLLFVALLKQNWDGVKLVLGAIQHQLARIPSLLGRGQQEQGADVELGPLPAPPRRSAGIPRNQSDDEILARPAGRARSVRM